jgi:site-specific recombinase XerD
LSLRAAVEAFLLSCNGVASKATQVWYRRRLFDLADYLDGVDISLVTVSDLRRWRVALLERGTLSVYTLHGYVRAARRFFRWLEDEGILACSPARRLELPRLPKGQVKGIEHEDLKKMLAAASTSPRDLALTWFFYSTAARLAGVAGLRLRDLHLERGSAVVTEKGNKTRVVFLVPQAVDALRAWLAVRLESSDDHVFLGLRGPLKPSGVYQVLERLAKGAGVVSGWNPHSFRHRRLRDLQAAGVSLGVVSQIAGHADVSVTVDIYGRLPENELQRASQIPLPF